jgi:hypothetical protein
MDLSTQILLLASSCVCAAVMARVLWILNLWVPEQQNSEPGNNSEASFKTSLRNLKS